MNNKKTYKISLLGCDDYTEFKMRLSKEEYRLLLKVGKKSEKISTYQCMPILIIEDVDNKF